MLPSSLHSNLTAPDLLKKTFASVSHALEFDGVDFDEPMEVGPEEEEEKAVVKDEDKSKLAAEEVAIKVEPKAEAHDPVLA